MAGVAVMNPVKINPFSKIQKLYETANQKIVKYDITDITDKITFTITLEQLQFFSIPPPPPPSTQLTHKKKSKLKKLKGPQRKNQLVKNNTQVQVPYSNQMAIPIPIPNPPIDWNLDLALLLIYFKKVEEKVNQQIRNTTENLSQDNLERLETLTSNLEDFLEKLGRFYHEENVAQSTFFEHPQFQEILECTDRLQLVLDELEDSQIPEILKSQTIKPNKFQYLAAILGFEEELATFLIESDNYYSDEQLILQFIEGKEQALLDIEEFNTWDEAFQKLGFTQVKAKILSDLADENPFSSHESPAKWAFRHIEQEFKYNILLSNLNSENDWNQTNAIDVEYKIPTSVDEDPIFMKAVDKFKLTKEELLEEGSLENGFFTDYLRQEQNPIDGVTYWFHGTDHGSALSIIRDGIDVTKGNKELDFSDGAGFYLTR